MTPCTTYLPSDLIDTQALSLARIFTSNGCVPVALELLAGELGLVTPGVWVASDDAITCLLALEAPVFAVEEFKSTEGTAVGLACAPEFGFVAPLGPGIGVLVPLVSEVVEGVAGIPVSVTAGLADTGVVTVPELLA
jgi:hypothetical protein